MLHYKIFDNNDDDVDNKYYNIIVIIIIIIFLLLLLLWLVETENKPVIKFLKIHLRALQAF
jgi:hypothetical protein